MSTDQSGTLLIGSDAGRVPYLHDLSNSPNGIVVCWTLPVEATWTVGNGPWLLCRDSKGAALEVSV